MKKFVLWYIFILMFVGCTPSSDTEHQDAAVGACTSPAECDDGFSCTVDTCVSGSCHHAVGSDTGPTACPAGQFCVLGQGCIPGKACAKDADCVDTDACHVAVHCDSANAICVWKTLDKDGDGHPPVVCGGDDCNDNDATVYPGAPELCNGRDENCNDRFDDNVVDCGSTKTCTSGVCVCKPENLCDYITGKACLDFMTSTEACGGCGKFCPALSTSKCVAGVCDCDAVDKCGGVCVDKQYNTANCGTCGHACAPGEFCMAGTCGCPDTWYLTCPPGDKKYVCTDALNCGDCGKACASGQICVKGLCAACPAPSKVCGTTCTDTSTDSLNCGTCGHACPSGQTCSGGVCTCSGTPKYMTCGTATVDVHCDNNNCGACGLVCPTGWNCDAGRCV